MSTDPRALRGKALADAGDFAAALPELLAAARAAPGSEVIEGYLLWTLSALGRDAEVLRRLPAIARRQGFDAAAARRELAKAGMPTDALTLLLNAIRPLHAYRAIWERALEPDDPGSAAREAAEVASERRAARIDARRVPAALRGLIPLAREFGIGDDGVREAALRLAPKARLAALRKALSAPLGRRIDAWLDTFPDAAKMTPEAARFMYLSLALEEVLAARRRSRRS